MGPRAVAIFALLLVSACGGGPGGGSGGGGISSYGLQSSDVPSGFTSCSISGDVATSSDKDIQGEWAYLQQQGATAGYIQVYAATSGDCQSIVSSGPGSQNGGSKKLIASVVLQFKDAASAQKGASGSFGIGTSGLKSAGGAAGSSVGLGSDSEYLYSSAAGGAAWDKGVYMAGVVEQNLKESDLKKAISAVNGRLP